MAGRFSVLKQLASPKFVVVLGIGVLLAWPSMAENLSPGKVFGGTGDFVTEPFTIGDGWSVEWSSEDGGIDIVLNGASFEIPSLVASTVGPDRGKTVYARGGTFYFKVSGQGRWRIEVYEKVF